MLVVCFVVALSGCADKKDKKKGDGDAAPTEAQLPLDKERSFLAKGCEEHGDAAKKANCLCRVDVLDATLDGELLAKLETAPKSGPSEAVAEHVGGAANLSRIYEAMRKASVECDKGASK